jgi:urease accessory protein
MSYLIWQLVDSGFPSGGFAHSGGLEASVHHGQVANAASLHAFARQVIAQAGRASLPLVTAAHRDPLSLGELDHLCEAFLVNVVANRASRAQGRALLSSAARSFPQSAVRSLEDRARREHLLGHHAPVFGAVLKLLGADMLETQRLFLFLTGRGVGSAAVRLGLIGGYDAQELQTLLGADIDRVLTECGGLGPLEISQTAPLVDLCQSTHDRLYSRLFQS